MTFALLLFTFCLAAGLTHYFASPQARLNLLDTPNARSLHTRPTPVTGGIAIFTSLAVNSLIATFLFNLPAQPLLWIAISTLLVASVSLIDDWRTLSPLHRLGVHFIAAYLILAHGNLWITEIQIAGELWHLPSVLQILGSLLFVVWSINLYNFMDGMDGFAGGMAVFGFGSLAILGALAGNSLFIGLNLLIVAATLGFLIFNFSPARIFMGDTGSSSLGLLAAALSLWGSQSGIFPLWMALLIFSPFIVDATVTLARRAWQGEKIWLAHRSHYYQRLVQLGWGHKRTVLTEYVLMAACSVSAFFALNLPVQWQWVVLLLWVGIYTGLIWGVQCFFIKKGS